MNQIWMKKLHHAAVIGLLALFACAAPPTQAAVPGTLNYQGKLADAAGVPVNGAVNIAFKLYGVASGGTPLWSETQSVTVSNGEYSVTLGQPATPLTPTLFSVPLYLGIAVDSDAEMTPRVALSSVPYALQCSGCSTGFTNCSGACANLSSDLGHCGSCGTTCAAGHVCSAGACVLSCQVGLANCSGTCTNTSNDSNHCGSCGTTCPAGYGCFAGNCSLVCAGGTVNCSGACKDLSVDTNNCGACGNVCSTGQACVASVCQ